MPSRSPRYCSQCGHALMRQVPVGDHIERPVCGGCGFVHYQNPKVVVACIGTWEDKVLWIRRGTEPRKGFWAIPSGFAEQGETPEQAAVRELFEETGAVIEADQLNLFLVGSLPEISEVYLVYFGALASPEYATTHEASEIALFAADEAPWDEYAYPDVADAMQQFYRDHEKRDYGVYIGRYDNGINHFRSARA